MLRVETTIAPFDATPGPRRAVGDKLADDQETQLMSARNEEVRGLRRLWRDYSLSIVVGALFLAAFVLHGLFGWWQYAADQAQNGSAATLWGPDGYVIYFGEWTFQNWQSEFLEVYLLIVLTAFLTHKGSHESKDGEEEIKSRLGRIERQLDQIADKGS